MPKVEKTKSIENKGAGKALSDLQMLQKLVSEAMNSKEYNSLEKQVDTLIEIFFDCKKSFICERDKYKDDLKYRSFVLLFHAEIEDYLEQIATRILKEAKEKWNEKNALNNALANLLIRYYRKNPHAPKERRLNICEEKKLKEILTFSLMGEEIEISDIEKVIERIIELQKNSINESNNGIRWGHIERMLNPLGVSTNEFKNIDNILIIELENLSNLRGSYAHISNEKINIPKYRSQDDFTGIIRYLGLFDVWLIDRNIIDN